MYKPDVVAPIAIFLIFLLYTLVLFSLLLAKQYT